MNGEIHLTLRRWHLVLGGAALALLTLVVVVAATRGGPQPGATGAVGPTIPVGAPTPVRTAAGSSGAPAAATSPAGGDIGCPPATVAVADATALVAALQEAQPGTSIRLKDGVYSGEFKATTAGSAQQPVFLCGGPRAILDGGSVSGGYGFHLDGASYWRLVGFTVRNAQKGVMADRTQGAVIQGLTVEQIGDEAIHLRNFSTDNVVRGNTVRDTGKRKDKFGEGIYIGTAESNWCTVTACQPDRSDRNTIRDNTITATTAESIDIKEGTTGGVVSGNTFDGSALSGSHADSWVDVKGNGWLIEHNTGRNTLTDGYQTHEVVDGWGADNTFKANRAEVNGPGYGFNFTKPDGNRLTCDNTATGAGKGLANVTCI
jgi:hypothetical protein